MSSARPSPPRSVRGRAALWLLFFAIAFGLGYPTLNRYDPARTPGTSDAGFYARMALEGPEGVPPPWRYRMVVPLMVRPIARAADGKLGSWSAVGFGFLVVNSALLAASCLVLLGLASSLGRTAAEAAVGTLLLLLNFSIPNFHLAGLVDSIELLVALGFVRAVVEDRWWLLPLLIAAGTVAKETILPLGVAFAAGWLASAAFEGERLPHRWGWLVLTGLAGVAGMALNQSLIDGTLVLPWSIGIAQTPSRNFLQGLFDSLTSNNLVYTFVWLVPLAAVSLSLFPRRLVWGTVAAMVAALLIGAWATIEGNVGRPMFNIGAPLLTLSAGCTLLRLLHSGHSPRPEA